MGRFFGIGIYHCRREENIGTLFRSAQTFGASFIYTIGRRYRLQASDTTNAGVNIPLFHYADLDDLFAHLPVGCRLVGIENCTQATELPHYWHPKIACYLLGAEDHGLSPAALERCHDLVQIPGGRFCLNVSVAGSIILYDRIIKAEPAVVQPRRSPWPSILPRLAM